MAAPDEQHALGVLDDAFRVEQARVPTLLGANGKEIELPESLFNLLRQLVRDLSSGRSIMLVSRGQMLTTRQAADILNVSRPHLVKLLEENQIPFMRTGTHRRISFDDLIAYKQRRDAQRRRGLAQITQMGEEMGDYD